MPQDIQQPRQICSFRSSSRSRAERSVLVAAFCEIGGRSEGFGWRWPTGACGTLGEVSRTAEPAARDFRLARILRCSTGGAEQR